jgi:hypothetical protein
MGEFAIRSNPPAGPGASATSDSRSTLTTTRKSPAGWAAPRVPRASSTSASASNPGGRALVDGSAEHSLPGSSAARGGSAEHSLFGSPAARGDSAQAPRSASRLAEPFGERTCLGFAEQDHGWLGAVAEQRPVRHHVALLRDGATLSARTVHCAGDDAAAAASTAIMADALMTHNVARGVFGPEEIFDLDELEPKLGAAGISIVVERDAAQAA